MRHAGRNGVIYAPQELAGMRRVDPWSLSLPQLLDPDGARPLLQAACSASGWTVLAVLGAEVVDEIPGRRRTLRYRVLSERAEGPREYRWLAKQFRGSNGEQVWRVLRFVHMQISPEVLTAEPVGYSREHRLLVTAELEGATMAQSLRGTPEDDVEVGLRRAGRAIASLHRFARGPEAALKRHGPREEIEALELARARAGGSALGPA